MLSSHTEKAFGIMPHSSSSPSAGEAVQTIESRFGTVEVDRRKAVTFPRGLLGMPDKAVFALVNFPGGRMQQFTLLQSLDDPKLSFITLPLAVQNAIVDAKHLREASQLFQMEEANLAVLLIVSVHRHPSEVRLSVNARAPLFIDTEHRLGVQYVFPYDQYKVQHML